MRVSCACPRQTATSTLVEEIEGLGLQPIVTNIIVRAVYEGPDRRIGEGIVQLFSREIGHTVCVGDYQPPTPKPAPELVKTASPKKHKKTRTKTRNRSRR